MAFYSFANLTAFRAAQPPTYDTSGTYFSADTGQNYHWDPTSLAVDNGTTIIKPNATVFANGSGRYIANTAGEGADVLQGMIAMQAANTPAPLAAGVAATDGVQKVYAEQLASGKTALAAVAVASTANIAALTGEQTIDGVLTSASRVLLKNQTTASQNGVWVTGAGAWTRPTDFATGAHAANLYVYVLSGSTNGKSGFVCSAVFGSDVVDTNALPFTSSPAAHVDQSGLFLAALGGTSDDAPVFANSLVDGNNPRPVVYSNRGTANFNTSADVTGREQKIVFFDGVTINANLGHTASPSNAAIKSVPTANGAPTTVSSLPGNHQVNVASSTNIAVAGRITITSVTWPNLSEGFVVVAPPSGAGPFLLKLNRELPAWVQVGDTVQPLALPAGSTSAVSNDSKFVGPMTFAGIADTATDFEYAFNITFEQLQVRSTTPPGYTTGFRFKGCEHIGVKDCVLNGFLFGNPAGGNGLEINSCEHVDVTNLQSKGWAGEQLRVIDSYRVRLAGCDLSGFGGGATTGLHVTATVGSNSTDLVSYVSGSITGCNVGILVDNGARLFIGADVDITDCTTALSIATGGVVLREQSGVVSITTLTGTVALTFKQCGAKSIETSGLLTGTLTLTVLPVPGMEYELRNGNTGAFATQIKTVGGATTIAVAQGDTGRVRITAAGDLERIVADTAPTP